MSSLFQQIRDVVKGKEAQVASLERERESIENLVASLDIDQEDYFDSYIVFNLRELWEEEIAAYVRGRLIEGISFLCEKIANLRVGIQRLNIKLHYLKRNLRANIRLINRSLFKKLDDIDHQSTSQQIQHSMT